MYYNNQADPVLMAAYFAMELLKPVFIILFVCFILWTIARFLVELCSVDGGRGRREQRQRHRLQILILGVAIACGATGIVMTQNGYGEGAISIELPGGMKIQNGGMAVVFTSAMLFVLWLLVRMSIDTKEVSEQAHASETAAQHSGAGRATDAGRATAAGRATELPSGAAATRIDLAGVSELFRNVTYLKAGVVTLVLLPFFGPVALLPGCFLAFKVWQRRGSFTTPLLPPPE